MPKNFEKKIIGVDFDNTIINYLNVFKKILRQNKITFGKNLNKAIFKKKIIKKFSENYYTQIQSILYGKNILFASKFANVKKNLTKLKKNYTLYLISHKSKYPILGEKINLRKKALEWLKKNNLYGYKKVFNKKNIFFEEKFDDKIKKIKQLKCDYFIDDLSTILDGLPINIKKIKFGSKSDKYKYFYNWNKISKIIKQNDFNKN